jgi:hypothetical protein
VAGCRRREPPRLFAKQVDFLDGHPAVTPLGTWSEIRGEDRPASAVTDLRSAYGELQARLLHDDFFVQSSVMPRRSVVVDIAPYTTDSARQPPEDFTRWSRTAARHPIADLAEVFVIDRERPGVTWSRCCRAWFASPPMSARPDRSGMRVALRAATTSLCGRFPAERDAVEEGIGEMSRRVCSTHRGRFPGGVALRPVGAPPCRRRSRAS